MKVLFLFLALFSGSAEARSPIVKFKGCSAFIFAFEGAPRTNPALMMTNGHCVYDGGGNIEPGVALGAFEMSLPVIFSDEKEVLTKSRIYATQTDSDIAIYALDGSYEDLDIEPLILSASFAPVGTYVKVPSGFSQQTHRARIGSYPHAILEGRYSWNHPIRLEEMDELPDGSSGSPLVSETTGQVVGIYNTANEAGELCTSDNPCELGKNGKKEAFLHQNYGQVVSGLYSCLDDSFQVKASVAGCKLVKTHL